MDKILRQFERNQHTREIYLSMFKEEGVSEEELMEGIRKSYVDQGYNYGSFKDIPIIELEETIMDCCEIVGLKFKCFDDILKYFYKTCDEIG